VSNPEFLREGVAVPDFMKPDRVVIGTSSDKAKKVMEQLYRPFVLQGNPIYFMDERSAEVTKYAANSYLATRISFMNEIANLCELVGANVDHVRKGMGSDGRIGKRFLFAGIGYGGSCFPKDVKALAKTSDTIGYDFKILKSVMNVNRMQKLRMAEKMMDYYDGALKGKVVALWGLAFKPNTDDIREAPALETIQQLLDAGAEVRAFDPEAMDNVRELVGDKITFTKSKYEATNGADCLAIMTEWNEFRTPDFGELKNQLKDKVIFDGRNLYDLDILQDAGLAYLSIGRSPVNLEHQNNGISK
jgi:UDPglucose 6-dehydrogenase